MENRLKERLTGAAILVALIVLVVPEMFRGQHDRSAGAGSPSGEGPPLRSYTLDLSTTGTDVAPMQITAGAHSATVPVAQPSIAPAVSPAAGAAARVTAALPITVTRTAPASRKAAPSARPPAATLALGWEVQLGLFAKLQNAQRLLRSAQAKGFSARVARSGAKGLYRVSVDGLADRSAAEQMSRRLRAAGFAAAVRAPRENASNEN